MSAGTDTATAGHGFRPRRPSLAAARRLVGGDLVSLRVIVAIALIWIIFQALNGRFLSAVNLTNLVLQITATGLISVGVVFVLRLGRPAGSFDVARATQDEVVAAITGARLHAGDAAAQEARS